MASRMVSITWPGGPSSADTFWPNVYKQYIKKEPRNLCVGFVSVPEFLMRVMLGHTMLMHALLVSKLLGPRSASTLGPLTHPHRPAPNGPKQKLLNMASAKSLEIVIAFSHMDLILSSPSLSKSVAIARTASVKRVT